MRVFLTMAGIIAGLMLCVPTADAQFARQEFIPID